MDMEKFELAAEKNARTLLMDRIGEVYVRLKVKSEAALHEFNTFKAEALKAESIYELQGVLNIQRRDC